VAAFGIIQRQVADDLERSAFHHVLPAGQRGAVVIQLHVMHDIVPRSLEQVRRFGREIHLRHRDIHLRLFGRLILSGYNSLGRRCIASLETLLRATQL